MNTPTWLNTINVPDGKYLYPPSFAHITIHTRTRYNLMLQMIGYQNVTYKITKDFNDKDAYTCQFKSGSTGNIVVVLNTNLSEDPVSLIKGLMQNTINCLGVAHE